ncbi:MAG: AtpZ/AtpI family protein [Acidiphilium sp.]|nr:AtpZ/AtpI family protein [Acidiphilium sp.]MDD4934916.1 AtpZ/AtpI family protein [Acidiphilium sp.]
MGDDQARGPDDRPNFDQRLAAARHRAGLDQPEPVSEPAADGPNPFSLAMRLGAEMVAALVVAVAIGYGLDRLFHTAPWFMIGFVPIGAAAGLRNVIRAMGTTPKD